MIEARPTHPLGLIRPSVVAWLLLVLLAVGLLLPGNAYADPDVGDSTSGEVAEPSDEPVVSGWFDDEATGERKYRLSSGDVATGWQWIEGKWYLFDSKSGRMLTGWQKIDGYWYYLKPGSGNMLAGWQKVGSYWYYLKPGSGHMLMGWQKVGGKWYYLRTGDSGRMLTGWQKVGGYWYYLKPGSGHMLMGWQKVGGKWYYLRTGGSGRMLTGWQWIGGKWYYLENSGAMHEGWIRTDGKYYYCMPRSGAWNASIPAISQDYRSSFVHGNKPAKYQKYIVLHDTEGGGTANGVIDYWDGNGSGVAAHFVINKDGSIVQCVPLDKITHHAGYGNKGHNKKYGVTDESRDDKKGTTWVSSSLPDYGMNSYSIGIEMIHSGNAAYPEAQLDALDRLIAYIDYCYGFESTIIDHKMWRSGNSDTSAAFKGYLANYRDHRAHD